MASTPRGWPRRRWPAGGAATDGGRGHLDALVFLADLLRPRQRALAPARSARRARARRSAATSASRARRWPPCIVPPSPSAASIGGQPAGGAHDVIVQRAAEDRDQDDAVLDLLRLLQGRLRDGEALAQRLALAAPVDHVEREPAQHPRAAGEPGALVQDHHGDPAGASHQRPERGRDGHRSAPDVDRQRHPERPRAVGSRKRSRITDRCAIVNASIAPKAKMPARNSMSPESASPKRPQGRCHALCARGRGGSRLACRRAGSPIWGTALYIRARILGSKGSGRPLGS